MNTRYTCARTASSRAWHDNLRNFFPLLKPAFEPSHRATTMGSLFSYAELQKRLNPLIDYVLEKTHRNRALTEQGIVEAHQVEALP